MCPTSKQCHTCAHHPGLPSRTASAKRQVSRVEEYLAEAWQSFRAESRARPSLPSPSPPLAVTQRSPGQQRQQQQQQQTSPGPRSQHLNAGSLLVPPVAPAVLSEPSPSGRAVAHGRGGGGGDGSEGVPLRVEAVSAAVVEIVAVVGAAEYLQWLGDMSNMLVHEQWRKEVGLCVCLCVPFRLGTMPIVWGGGVEGD